VSSPAYAELEAVVTDWLGKAIGLPRHFIYAEGGGKGGKRQLNLPIFGLTTSFSHSDIASTQYSNN